MKVEFVNRERSASVEAFSFGVVGTHTYLFVPKGLAKNYFAVFSRDKNYKLNECFDVKANDNLKAIRLAFPMFVNDYTNMTETGDIRAVRTIANGYSLRNLHLPNYVSQFMLIKITGDIVKVELCVVSKEKLSDEITNVKNVSVPCAVGVISEPAKSMASVTGYESDLPKVSEPVPCVVKVVDPLKWYPKTYTKTNDFVHNLGTQATEPIVLKPKGTTTIKTVSTSSVSITNLIEMGGLLYLGGEGVSRAFTVVTSTDLPEMSSCYDCNAVIVSGLKIISDTTPQSPYFSNDTSVKVDDLIDAVIFMQDCGFCVTGYKYRRQIGGGDLVVMMTTLRGKRERPSRKVIEDRLKAIFAI